MAPLPHWLSYITSSAAQGCTEHQCCTKLYIRSSCAAQKVQSCAAPKSTELCSAQNVQSSSTVQSLRAVQSSTAAQSCTELQCCTKLYGALVLHISVKAVVLHKALVLHKAVQISCAAQNCKLQCSTKLSKGAHWFLKACCIKLYKLGSSGSLIIFIYTQMQDYEPQNMAQCQHNGK